MVDFGHFFSMTVDNKNLEGQHKVVNPSCSSGITECPSDQVGDGNVLNTWSGH